MSNQSNNEFPIKGWPLALAIAAVAFAFSWMIQSITKSDIERSKIISERLRLMDTK